MIDLVRYARCSRRRKLRRRPTVIFFGATMMAVPSMEEARGRERR